MASSKTAGTAEKVRGSDAFLDREFPMSGSNFRAISKLAYDHSGIVLSDHKQQMVYSRLARRIRELQMHNFDAYLRKVNSHWEEESTAFLNALTTNLTSFFRENHHFNYMAKHVVPELKKIHAHDKKIRVWCAAASTGEEPYSIGMVLRETFPGNAWDIKILATDIDSNVLATAKKAVYGPDRVEDFDPSRLKKWFRKAQDGSYQIVDSVRSLLTFNQLNLLQSWPIKGPFDIVFCRNVIIYYDQETQKTLFKKIHKVMAKDAHLFIGHSESLFNVCKQFDLIGRTVYRRSNE
jgi:chemotaxis protein methyltransferase CheR